MRDNDLSSSVVPRMLFIYEGLVAIPPKNTLSIRALTKVGSWSAVIRRWGLNPFVTKRMWDLAWRYDFRLDVVTFLPEAAVDAISKQIETAYLPVSNVWSCSARDLWLRLSAMPDVARVFDPDPKRALSWGSRGAAVDAGMDWEPLR